MNRDTIGMLLAAVGGAVFAWGLMSVLSGALPGICIADSLEDCGVSTNAFGALMAGIVIFVISAFFAPVKAWFTGPLVGLGTAAYLGVRGGAEIDSGNLGMFGFIAVCVLLGPAILVVIYGRQKAKAKLAAELVQTGRRAVARVQSAQQTGVYINERPQLQVTYQVQPLDGTPPFVHTKKQLVDYGGIQPMPGLAWPAWYDPADQSKVAVGAPSGYTQETLQLLQEFGIPVQQAFGYDPSGAAGPGGMTV